MQLIITINNKYKRTPLTAKYNFTIHQLLIDHKKYIINYNLRS